uniref:Uncharacterized protein n=1 Tax=Anguilla anguilla TaxID=7936 RepID=A0A0E9UFN1_ANGAN
MWQLGVNVLLDRESGTALFMAFLS